MSAWWLALIIPASFVAGYVLGVTASWLSIRKLVEEVEKAMKKFTPL